MSEQDLELLMNEIEILHNVEHSNIMNIKEIYKDAKTIYIVTNQQ